MLQTVTQYLQIFKGKRIVNSDVCPYKIVGQMGDQTTDNLTTFVGKLTLQARFTAQTFSAVTKVSGKRTRPVIRETRERRQGSNHSCRGTMALSQPRDTSPGWDRKSQRVFRWNTCNIGRRMWKSRQCKKETKASTNSQEHIHNHRDSELWVTAEFTISIFLTRWGVTDATAWLGKKRVSTCVI